jgi:hypothetical protein
MTTTAVALFKILWHSLLLAFALHACSLSLILSVYGTPYAKFIVKLLIPFGHDYVLVLLWLHWLFSLFLLVFIAFALN